MSEETVTIYSLSCPLDGKVKYIGATKSSLQERLKQHKSQPYKANAGKAYWIRYLKDYGFEPIIEELEKTTPENAGACEKKWIRKYEEQGFYLFNIINL